MATTKDRDFVRFPEIQWVSVNLLSIREARGLTQQQVSLLSGTSIPYLSALENGRGSPSLEALSQLAKALDVTVSELVEDPELRRKRLSGE